MEGAGCGPIGEGVEAHSMQGSGAHKISGLGCSSVITYENGPQMNLWVWKDI